VEIAGATVAEALESALRDNDQLRSYVMDEQGRIRRHIALFVDGQIVVDRLKLSDPIQADSEIYVMQALSGG
jgi:sulfur carrier protein ThiS